MLPRTHCGLGAPQSMQRLFSFVFAISPSLERVSGSTSHILLILAVSRAGCVWSERFSLACYSPWRERAVEMVGRSGGLGVRVVLVVYDADVILSRGMLVCVVIYKEMYCATRMATPCRDKDANRSGLLHAATLSRIQPGHCPADPTSYSRPLQNRESLSCRLRG
jgi:hypothetical protein